MLACPEPNAARHVAGRLTPSERTVDDDDIRSPLPDDLERLLAGTMALMTAWYRCPQPAICHTLIANLSLIGRHDAVSDALRRVCSNAAARWAAYLEEIELAIEAGETEDCDDDADALSADAAAGGAAARVTLH